MHSSDHWMQQLCVVQCYAFMFAEVIIKIAYFFETQYINVLYIYKYTCVYN